NNYSVVTFACLPNYINLKMIKSSFKPSPFKPPSRIPLKPSTSDNIPNTSQEKKVNPLTLNPSKRIKVDNDSADDENTYRFEPEDPEDENRTRKIPKNDYNDSSDTDTSLPSAIRCNLSLPAPMKKFHKPFIPPTFLNPPPFLRNQEGIQKKRPGRGPRHVVKKPSLAPDEIVLDKPYKPFIPPTLLNPSLNPLNQEGIQKKRPGWGSRHVAKRPLFDPYAPDAINDLSEYFSLLNFANPNFLGTPSEFRRNYENPILRGRDADASEKERETSDQKLSELLEVKLCNHPDLLDLPKELRGSQKCFPPGYSIKDKARTVKPEFSGKMLVLDR
ncbi:8796_t:CDS:2, partial [Racocetra fulgida]